MTCKQLALALEMFANANGDAFSWVCITTATGGDVSDGDVDLFWRNIPYVPGETNDDIFTHALEAAARLRGY